MKLNDIAEFVTDKISSSGISLDRYVTTDSLLQNRRGRETAQNLPPMPCALTHYRQGDVLVANIRPYLKRSGMLIQKVVVLRMFWLSELRKGIVRHFFIQF